MTAIPPVQEKGFIEVSQQPREDEACRPIGPELLFQHGAIWFDPGRLKYRQPAILRGSKQPLSDLTAKSAALASQHLNYDLDNAIRNSWKILNDATKLDPSLPKKNLFPCQYPENGDHPFLEPIYKLYDQSIWEICGNWMTNPHDPDQRIAVFQYPIEDQIIKCWQLCQEYNLPIIDLTNSSDIDEMKVLEKQFYPPLDGMMYGRFDEKKGIRFGVQCMYVNAPLRFYRVMNQDQVSDITVFHYSNWPDGSAIDIDSLEGLVDYVLRFQKIAIHCKAGVGRTGVLTTAAFIKHLVITGKLTKEDFNLTWLNLLLLRLRSQRSRKWVQTYEQYELLYKFALRLFERIEMQRI